MSTSRQRRVTLDEVLAAIGLLTDQIAVLVSAVDDLRCEIEWQDRNGMNRDSAEASATAERGVGIDEVGNMPALSTLPESPDDSLLSAGGRLRAFERACSQGRRSLWLDEWATEDDFEIPAGRMVSVDADLWSAVLDIRPAHVVGEGCCCEEGIGAPYLLAWKSGDEFLLRELTEEQACKLQELCLACQAVETARHDPDDFNLPAQAQLGLF